MSHHFRAIIKYRQDGKWTKGGLLPRVKGMTFDEAISVECGKLGEGEELVVVSPSQDHPLRFIRRCRQSLDPLGNFEMIANDHRERTEMRKLFESLNEDIAFPVNYFK